MQMPAGGAIWERRGCETSGWSGQAGRQSKQVSTGSFRNFLQALLSNHVRTLALGTSEMIEGVRIVIVEEFWIVYTDLILRIKLIPNIKFLN